MTQTHTPLPCPLCAGEARIARRSGVTGKVCRSRYYRERVLCSKCGLSTAEEKAPGKAVEKWNRRAPDASQAAEIARLRNKVPARSLTDSQLRDEIKAVDAVLDAGFGEGSGSPGEWWYERADELEHERKRRELEAHLSAHNTRAALEPRS